VDSLNKEYDGYGRTMQMMKNVLWGPSSATSGFHLILSDGVAALLLTHLKGSKIDAQTRALFQHAYDRLTSRDEREGWTSGLWMTERAGGSDLTPTETTATYSPLGPNDNAKDADGFPLGPWVLNGLKWFSTGTEASMAVTIARTPSGLSAFYVPMRRAIMVDGVAAGTELNGVRIRRVKQKMGTKPLPTSELDLKGMRGWMIGKEGKGIPEIGVVLNITRIHLTVGICGYAGRALGAARAFARVRKVARGTRLSSVPLHMKSLAKAHIIYRAHLVQAFFVTALLAKHEQTQTSSPPTLDIVPQNTQDAACLLRLLGSVAKATAAVEALGVVHSGMEALGGLGYMENDDMGFNVARLYRDAAATCIGEGTTDVLATDAVKVMKGKIGTYVMKSYGRWIKASLPTKESFAPEAAILSSQWSELQTAVSSNSLELLTMNGRSILERVSKLTSGILLLADAARDDNPVAIEVARRWIRPVTLLSGTSVEQELLYDQQIVFGDQPTWCGLP
jgi:alkylation response protein AidB-like acyl-CoA dehydrogenase